MSEQEENQKPQYEGSPISNSITIKFIVDFLMSIPASKQYRRKVFDAFEDELNMYPCKENGFKQGKYPFQGMTRSEETPRLFKDFYVSRFVTFSNHKFQGVRFGKKDRNGERPIATPSVETDHVIFEQVARNLGINNEISRNNLYFDMKLKDFQQGIMQVYEKAEIEKFIENEYYPYLKFEPQQVEYKERKVKIDESKRMYSIDDLF